MHPRQVSRVVLDLAPELHGRIRVHAEQEGITVADYLIREAERATTKLWGRELWEHLKNLPRTELGESSADLVRAGREERMRYLDELFEETAHRR